MDRVLVRQIASMAGPGGHWPQGTEHEVEYGEALRLADAGIAAIVGAPFVAEEASPAESEAVAALRQALGEAAPLEVLAELASEARADGVPLPADLAAAVAVIDIAAFDAEPVVADIEIAPAPEPSPPRPTPSPAGPAQRTR
jgi:hypothetical protein